MPTKRANPEETIAEVRWVEKLPEQGGSWGRGLVMTVKDQAKEVRQLMRTEESIKRQISDRMKLMRGMTSRAEREAELTGYTKAQINDAQVEVQVEDQEREAAAEAAAKEAASADDGEDD